MNKKFFKIFLITAMCIICVLLCVVSYLLGAAHGRKQAALALKAYVSEKAKTSEKRSTIASRDTVDSVAEEMDRRKPIAPQSYEVVMNTEWLFSADEEFSSNAYVENSRENECPVRFEVALADAPEEVLYRSPELSVGESLSEIGLNL